MTRDMTWHPMTLYPKLDYYHNPLIDMIGNAVDYCLCSVFSRAKRVHSRQKINWISLGFAAMYDVEILECKSFHVVNILGGLHSGNVTSGAAFSPKMLGLGQNDAVSDDPDYLNYSRSSELL